MTDWTKCTKDVNGRDVQGVRLSPGGRHLQWWAEDTSGEWWSWTCRASDAPHFLTPPTATRWYCVFDSGPCCVTFKSKEDAQAYADRWSIAPLEIRHYEAPA